MLRSPCCYRIPDVSPLQAGGENGEDRNDAEGGTKTVVDEGLLCHNYCRCGECGEGVEERQGITQLDQGCQPGGYSEVSRILSTNKISSNKTELTYKF